MIPTNDTLRSHRIFAIAFPPAAGRHGAQRFDGLEGNVEVSTRAPWTGRDEHEVVHTQSGEVLAAAGELDGGFAGADAAAERDLDVVRIPADGGTRTREDVEIVPKRHPS